jgi:hypothetical protein
MEELPKGRFDPDSKSTQERLKFWVQPFEDEHEKLRSYVYDFEKTLLQTILTLNASFLAAIPAFTALSFPKQLSSIVKYPMIIFAFSLFCSFICAIYFRSCLSHVAQEADRNADVNLNNIKRSIDGYIMPDSDPDSPQFANAERKAKEHRKKGISAGSRAEVFGSAAYISFVLGCLVFGWKLIEVGF